MKIIFVLALLIAVGAQDNDSSGDEDDNMSTGDDDGMDSDEFRNNGNIFSSSRSGRNDKSGIPKEMLRKLTHMCVDVQFPKEMLDSFKECLKEEAKKSTIFDNMLDGKFPDRQETAKFFESVEMCKMAANGVNDIDTDLTAEKISEFTMYDKWMGKDQDKEELRDKMVSCVESAQGSGFEKLVNSHKCMTEYYLDKCRTKDDDPGVLLLIYLKLLTLHEESKCASVKISEEMNKTVDECLEEGKTSFTNSPQSSEPSSPPPPSHSMKNIPKEFMKPIMAFQRFFKDYLVQGLLKCMGTKTDFFDFNSLKMNMTAFADKVRQFEGWEGIETERDAIYQGLVDCGRTYEDSMENDNDNDSLDEKIKDMKDDNEDFEECFVPKFAEICGYNSDFASWFDPMMNSEFIGKIFNAFKELLGQEAEDIITLLKGMLQKFKEQ